MLFLYACKPAISVQTTEINASKDIPRYCHKPRLFFYEIQSSADKARIWMQTKHKGTIHQLLKNDLKILFAEKKSKNVKYLFVYNAVLEKEKQADHELEDQSKINFYKITEADSVDITSHYNLNITSSLDETFYDLKVDFPLKILRSIEEPVIGIKSKGQTRQVKKKKTQEQGMQSKTGITGSMNNYQQGSHYNRTSHQNNQKKVVTYEELNTDIEIWFRLMLRGS